MEVTVEKSCERCGKTTKRTVSLEEAQRLSDMSKDRSENLGSLTVSINELLGGSHPDLIIAVRDEDTEEYVVHTLDDLCESPEAKRNRGCKSRVEYLLGDILMTNPPKKPSASTASEANPE